MPSTSQCKYCGAAVSSSDEHCPNCGAVNDGYVADTERHIFLPQTIDELKEYCAERGMPLLRMRFFIGEDYKKPKAFGIYKDGKNFVVYKNKANGQRAVRYRGPDEKYAVNELFMKLLEECHNRGIYPDGKFPDRKGTAASQRTKKSSGLLAPILAMVISLLLTVVFAEYSRYQHRKDGYYGTGDGNVYYRYGTSWYYSDSSADDWYKTDGFPAGDFEDYSLGSRWDSDWGVSNFKSSDTWNDIQESHSSSSSDYDSWDSGDTDWDSDW